MHRDFKPDNAIVGADGRVRVLDFGLALAAAPASEVVTASVDPPADDWARLTFTGNLLGTPAYMAPEQFAGKPTDARTDQFAFAIALFEALYGKHPFAFATFAELSSAVLQGRVQWPGTRRGEAREQRVLRRALATAPDERYGTTHEMIAALERAIGHTGRNVGLALAGTGAIVGLSWAFFGSRLGVAEDEARELAQERDTQRSRADAAEQHLQARADALTLAEARHVVRGDPTRAIALLANLSDDAREWGAGAWPVAMQAADLGVAGHVVTVPSGWDAVRFAGEHVELEARTTRTRARWSPRDGAIDGVRATGDDRLSPDGRWILTCNDEGLRLVQPSGTVGAEIAAACSDALFSGDGSHVAMTSGDAVWIARVEGGMPRSVAIEGWLSWLADDGASFVVSGRATVHYDVTTSTRRTFGEFVEIVSGIYLMGAVAPDGDRIAGPFGTSLRIYDVASGRATDTPIGSEVRDTSFDPTGVRIAVTTADAGIRVLDAGASPSPRQLPRGAAANTLLERLVWSRDGRGLCAIGSGEDVWAWDVESGSLSAFAGSVPELRDCRWRDDGALEVLTAGELRIVEGVGASVLAAEAVSVASSGDARAVAYTDGRLVVSRGVDERLVGTHEGVRNVKLSPAGDLLVSGNDGGLRAWPLGGIDRRDWVLTAWPMSGDSLTFDPTGRWLAWISMGEELTLLEIATGERRRIKAAPGRRWSSLTFEDDASLVAIDSGPDDMLQRLAPHTWTQAGAVPIPWADATDVLPLPDGTGFWVGTSSGTVAAVDRDGATLSRLASSGPAAQHLALSPDGRILAAARADGTVRLWNLASGDEYRPPLNPHPPLLDLAFALRQLARDRFMTFMSDGRLLVIDDEGVARAYTISVPLDPSGLREWVRGATDLRVAAGAIDPAPARGE